MVYIYLRNNIYILNLNSLLKGETKGIDQSFHFQSYFIVNSLTDFFVFTLNASFSPGVGLWGHEGKNKDFFFFFHFVNSIKIKPFRSVSIQRRGVSVTRVSSFAVVQLVNTLIFGFDS